MPNWLSVGHAEKWWVEGGPDLWSFQRERGRHICSQRLFMRNSESVLGRRDQKLGAQNDNHLQGHLRIHGQRNSQGMGSRNLHLSVPSTSPPASDLVSSDCRNLSTFPYMEGSLWATNFIHLSFSHTHRLASQSQFQILRWDHQIGSAWIRCLSRLPGHGLRECGSF